MKAKEFIKKLNLSTFKGTICVSEKELERHLEEFGKRRIIAFYDWEKSGSVDGSDMNYMYNLFLKEEA